MTLVEMVRAAVIVGMKFVEGNNIAGPYYVNEYFYYDQFQCFLKVVEYFYAFDDEVLFELLVRMNLKTYEPIKIFGKLKDNIDKILAVIYLLLVPDLLIIELALYLNDNKKI